MDNMQPQLQFTAFKTYGGVAGNEDWRAAISATGAIYHPNDEHWYLQKDAEPLPIDTVNTLFNIAKNHGAHITVELLPGPDHVNS